MLAAVPCRCLSPELRKSQEACAHTSKKLSLHPLQHIPCRQSGMSFLGAGMCFELLSTGKGNNTKREGSACSTSHQE